MAGMSLQMLMDMILHAIAKAVQMAKAMTDKPTMICCKTTIGFGSPNKAGSHACHGAALGQDEINLTKAALGWDHEAFVIPAEVYAGWDAKAKGAKAEKEWNEKFAAYKAAYPELAAEYRTSYGWRIAKKLES